MRKATLRQVIVLIATLTTLHAFASGGAASGIRDVHEDADGRLWIEYQALLKQYVDPINGNWVDHDHVDIYRCSYCSKTRPQ